MIRRFITQYIIKLYDLINVNMSMIMCAGKVTIQYIIHVGYN